MKCTTNECNNEADQGQHKCSICIVFYQKTNLHVQAQQKVAQEYMKISALNTDDRSVNLPTRRAEDIPMSAKYPKYYKRIPAGVTDVDTYLVNKLFPVADDSGCIIHARKKLLVPGTRTGGKSFYDDIKEARDTLTRWMELHSELATKK